MATIGTFLLNANPAQQTAIASPNPSVMVDCARPKVTARPRPVTPNANPREKYWTAGYFSMRS